MSDELEYERIDYTVNDTGKAIRRALRDAFPGVKFSLRGSRGTGYGWFSLSWTDGPTTTQVDQVTHSFRSSYFDGMDDSTHQIPATMYAGDDGVIREHRYSCHGVNTSRDYSEQARAWADAYADLIGLDVIVPDYGNPTYHDAQWRILQHVDLTGIDWDALPMPEPGFSGRHVPDSYCIDTGRSYWCDGEEGAHRADKVAA